MKKVTTDLQGLISKLESRVAALEGGKPVAAAPAPAAAADDDDDVSIGRQRYRVRLDYLSNLFRHSWS